MGDLDFSKLGAGHDDKGDMADSSDESDEDMPDLASDEAETSTEGKGKEPATS